VSATAARGETIAALTGLRAFGALWVVLHHVRPLLDRAAPDWLLLHHYADLGYLGVDLFSFLSGFVIAHNYAERLAHPAPGQRRRFFWLRVARLFPLHLFAMASLGGLFLALGSPALGPAEQYTAGGFVAQLLLVHAWGLRSDLDWNVPSWTVSAEWLCYLVFPLAAGPLVRLRRSGTALGLATAVVAATVAAVVALGHPHMNATLLAGCLRIGGEFAAGALLQRAHAAGGLAALPWTRLTVLALLAALLVPALSPATGLFAFGALVLALAHDRSAASRPLRHPVVVYLGEISYSIYLMHWIVLLAIQAAHPRLGPWIFLLLDFAAILGVAVLTHHAIERPARRAIRRRV
jgi:peptidoglycan/LPS O-acetylase OafA/YrhL